MKKYLILIGMIGLAVTACDSKKDGDDAAVTDPQEASDAKGTVMTIDTKSSTVSFAGVGVGKNHPGKFSFKSGEITLNDNTVTSGSFIIDINSMLMDQDGEMFQVKLREHLLSADFFDVTKYPDANFVITKVEAYTPDGKDTSVVKGANTLISGNLTLTGVTKNITFPAQVLVAEKSVQAIADFDIDRTEWKMNYNADQESMKEKFISHEVNIKLDITGRKGD